MNVWHSVALPIAVSLATTIVVSLSVGPRLAARNVRIQAAHDSRDRFGDSVLDILALCGNLRAVLKDLAPGDAPRPKIQLECERWEGQLDETTQWLADHWQRFALGYVGALGFRDLVVEYAATARGVWLSGRPLAERVRLLEEMTQPIQAIFFERRWRAMWVIQREKARLRATLDAVKKSGEEPQVAPETAPAEVQSAPG